MVNIMNIHPQSLHQDTWEMKFSRDRRLVHGSEAVPLGCRVANVLRVENHRAFARHMESLESFPPWKGENHGKNHGEFRHPMFLGELMWFSSVSFKGRWNSPNDLMAEWDQDIRAIKMAWGWSGLDLALCSRCEPATGSISLMKILDLVKFSGNFYIWWYMIWGCLKV